MAMDTALICVAAVACAGMAYDIARRWIVSQSSSELQRVTAAIAQQARLHEEAYTALGARLTELDNRIKQVANRAAGPQLTNLPRVRRGAP